MKLTISCKKVRIYWNISIAFANFSVITSSWGSLQVRRRRRYDDRGKISDTFSARWGDQVDEQHERTPRNSCKGTTRTYIGFKIHKILALETSDNDILVYDIAQFYCRKLIINDASRQILQILEQVGIVDNSSRSKIEQIEAKRVSKQSQRYWRDLQMEGSILVWNLHGRLELWPTVETFST